VIVWELNVKNLVRIGSTWFLLGIAVIPSGQFTNRWEYNPNKQPLKGLVKGKNMQETLHQVVMHVVHTMFFHFSNLKRVPFLSTEVGAQQ